MKLGGVATWVIVVTLVASPWRPGGISGGLGLQVVESLEDSGPRCPRASNCTCSDGNYIELICPVGENTITMKYSPGNFMDLLCEHQTPTNYAQLPKLDLGSSTFVKTFSFKMCPLPSSPFIDIINRAGVTKLNLFMFQAFGKNLTNTLHRSHLKGLGGVTRLTLSSNGLTDLPDDLFEDMTNLTWLELRSNNIRTIKGAFAPLVNLEFLQLASNDLPRLPNGVFSHLKRLRRLHLWQNRFTELHAEAFTGLDKLTELDLGSNAFTTFPEDVFSSLTNLEKINLYNNNFSSLPENLFAHNKKLTDIMLYYNRQQLKMLPEHFLSDLPKLMEVYLNSCELEVVPETTFKNSPEIRNISLNNNHISIIPPNLFTDQKNLLTLDLQSNRIKSIPDQAFRSLIDLEQLNLDNNAIEEISRDLFSQMNKLRTLNMQNNKLHHINKYAFSRMFKLNYVDMAYNQLNFRDSIFNDSKVVEMRSPFQHLPELNTLEYLNMSHNVITEIYADWRILLSRLTRLDLSFNQIENFTFNDIYFISSSIEIDLCNNNISEIDFSPITTYTVTLDDIPDDNNIYTKPAEKVKVFIENNPIKCDCLLHDFVQYLRSESDPRVLSSVNVIPGKTTCASPPNLEGKLLTKLVPLELTCPLNHLMNEMKCPEDCMCDVRLYDNAIIVDCSHSSHKSIPMLPNITGLTFNHTELHMEGNHIRLFMKNIDYFNVNNAHITELFLANNNITDLSFFGLSKGVEILDIRNNNIRHINSSVTDMLSKSTSLKKLWLSGNPIECECNNKEFLLFMHDKYKKIQDFSAVKCSDNSKVSTLTIGSLCGPPPIVIAVTVLLAIVCLISGITVALYYKYNHEIKVFLFSKGWFLFWLEEEELDKDKVYDAFISFSHKDDDFVANQLMPELEKGPNPFKICIHFRNWVAGEFIPTQIARSVEESRRTIVVLSPNFLESVWGKMEFRAAHSSALKEGRTRVIVILYGDIGSTDKLDTELQAYLSMNTYVKWGDPWFWHNLRYALPHPSSQNSLISNPLGRRQALENKLELINRNSPTTPPAQNTPPAHQAHTNSLMEHVNNAPNGGFKYPNIMSNGMLTMNGLKVNGNTKQSDV